MAQVTKTKDNNSATYQGFYLLYKCLTLVMNLKKVYRILRINYDWLSGLLGWYNNQFTFLKLTLVLAVAVTLSNSLKKNVTSSAFSSLNECSNSLWKRVFMAFQVAAFQVGVFATTSILFDERVCRA